MKFEKKSNTGFTLVELLVIIGIIGLLSGALLTSVSRLRIVAKRAQAQSAVNDTYTALSLYLQNEGEWHYSMINGLEMNELVCEELADKQLLDVSVASDSANSTSLERFGFLDEWGRDALKRNPSISASTQTGFDGIKIEDHRIQFRLDLNMDGVVDASEGSPNSLEIRSSVVVWSRGADGQDDFQSSNPRASNRYPYDDLISWDQGKVNAEN